MIERCSEELEEQVRGYLGERFGINQCIFDGHRFYSGSTGRVFLGPDHDFDLNICETCGILVARVHKSVKPSSLFFQMFGASVTRNIVTLDNVLASEFAAGEEIQLSDKYVGDATRGFVMVRYQRQPLGCGLLRGTLLESLLPKELRLPLSLL